jgi:hypothetical protein
MHQNEAALKLCKQDVDDGVDDNVDDNTVFVTPAINVFMQPRLFSLEAK